MGRYPEALHELDAALALARETWTSNVLLEFLYYDRSVVLYALGDAAGAGASYRRYIQLVGRPGDPSRNAPPATSSTRSCTGGSTGARARSSSAPPARGSPRR